MLEYLVQCTFGHLIKNNSVSIPKRNENVVESKQYLVLFWLICSVILKAFLLQRLEDIFA